jgi:hypothetical protein
MKTYYPGNYSGNDRRYNRNQSNYDSGLTNKGSNQYWRNGRHRQKSGPDSDAVLSEGITAIKDYLKEITDLQKRLIVSQEQIANAQEAHAEAMQQIAGCVKQFLGNSTNPSSIPATESMGTKENEPLESRESMVKEVPPEPAPEQSPSAKSVVESALKIIAEMRKNRVSFEKIADHLEAEGVPPVFGNGKWNRKTVSKFFKEAAA